MLNAKQKMVYDKLWQKITMSFEKLHGTGDQIVPGSDIDGVAVLLEKNFTQNIKNVIGVECPYFGKLLYLYFSEGLDQVKINSSKFIMGLLPFVLDDKRQEQEKICFGIYDIDRDN